MDPQHDSDISPGTVLAGKFRIERVLGRGGMGVVVAATHIHLQERVALKFLLPEALENTEAVARFEREARAAVKIKSEHVARVTDVGKMDNGSPYMVMEFLNGLDLGQYLEQNGPLPLSEAIDYLSQACEAIAEAHSLGIVHRDLKPANLFRILRSDGSPSIKVLDFGISKVSTGAEAAMTHTSSMMGSPYYMSPEQMTSAKNVDARTDVWALGIILHELLTGKVPYDGDTIPEVCARVLQNAPPPLHELRPELPDEVGSIIARALAKNRDERFDNVAEFTAALAHYGSDDSSRSVDRISRVLGVAPTTRESTAEFARNPTSPAPKSAESSTLGGAAHTHLDYRPPTTSHRPLAAAVVLLALAAGGGAWYASSPSDQGEALGPTSAGTAEPESGIAARREPEPTETADSSPQGPADADAPRDPSGSQQDATVSDASGAEQTPASTAAAVAPKPAPKPAPTPQPAPKPAPKPAPAPAPQPAPAPAPKPAPAPRPADSSSLFLDRK